MTIKNTARAAAFKASLTMALVGSVFSFLVLGPGARGQEQAIAKEHFKVFQKTPLAFEERLIGKEDMYTCYKTGMRERMACADFEVPENWDDPTGKKINLHMAILPAKGGFAEADPFIVFAGGPGQAASEYGRLIQLAFDKVNERRDIILIDQRGTGLSNGLSCYIGIGEFAGLSDQRLVDDVDQCLASYDVDVRHFTSFDAIKDFEYVRRRIGVEQWNIWGGSYGTRMGLLYMKTHPEAIRTAVLDGVAAPNAKLFETAPGDAQHSLDVMITDCLADGACKAAFPSIETQLGTLMQRLDETPKHMKWTDPMTGKTEAVTVDAEMVANLVRTALYAPSRWAMVPYVVHQAEAFDNYKPLMALGLDGSIWSGDSMFLGNTLSVLCSEEVPRNSADRAAAMGQGSFHRDYYYQFWATACTNWPIKPVLDGYEEPYKGDIPTLILSGGLDPVTPEPRGNDAGQYISNVWHLTARAAGHNVSHFACAPRLIGEFVKNKNLEKQQYDCMDKPIRPAFLLSMNGARFDATTEGEINP